MKTGDHVSIHSGSSYTEDATIEALCHPDELPAIDGAPNVEAVRAILTEGSFVAVAMITYKFLDQVLCFVAFQDTRGRWSDLKGQQLIIEPRTASNELETLIKNQRERKAAEDAKHRAWKASVDYRKF